MNKTSISCPASSNVDFQLLQAPNRGRTQSTPLPMKRKSDDNGAAALRVVRQDHDYSDMPDLVDPSAVQVLTNQFAYVTFVADSVAEHTVMITTRSFPCPRCQSEAPARSNTG